jgi:hypothetical protein
MSPANLRRYVVSALDYDLWQIVVEAHGPKDAINKAMGIYSFNGFEEFSFTDGNVNWTAVPLVPEVLS